ncbi:hypothetical protein ACJMK2_039664, partial [Sinanodonta woodiana]
MVKDKVSYAHRQYQCWSMDCEQLCKTECLLPTDVHLKPVMKRLAIYNIATVRSDDRKNTFNAKGNKP